MHTVHDSDHALRAVLARFPSLLLAIVFGSVARGQQHFASDLDIAVAAKHALSAAQKIDIIAALAAETGRPIDLIDLTTAELARPQKMLQNELLESPKQNADFM